MSAVSVGIHRRGISRHETLTVNHAASAGIVQVSVIGDAAINHGNTDSSSIQRVLLGGYVGFDCGSKALEAVVLESNFAIRGDVGDVRICFELGKSRHRKIESRGFDAMQFGPNPRATSCHCPVMFGGRSDFVLHDHIHPVIRMTAIDVAGNLPVRCAGALVEELRRRYCKARRSQDDWNC